MCNCDCELQCESSKVNRLLSVMGNSKSLSSGSKTMSNDDYPSNSPIVFFDVSIGGSPAGILILIYILFNNPK